VLLRRSTSGLGKGDGINNHTDKWLQASCITFGLARAATAAALALLQWVRHHEYHVNV
jgi:hypothetical protein